MRNFRNRRHLYFFTYNFRFELVVPTRRVKLGKFWGIREDWINIPRLPSFIRLVMNMNMLSRLGHRRNCMLISKSNRFLDAHSAIFIISIALQINVYWPRKRLNSAISLISIFLWLSINELIKKKTMMHSYF